MLLPSSIEFVDTQQLSVLTSQEYLPEVTGGSDVFTLGTEFLSGQSLQPAPLTVHMPALDGDQRVVVLVLCSHTESIRDGPSIQTTLGNMAWRPEGCATGPM